MAFRYLAFHKPYGVLSQFTREPGSDWGTLHGFGLPPRVYPAGRLDADSEGLLLLTDDGHFAHRLLQPRFQHPRVYWAQVEGVPSAEAMDRLRKGVMIRDYKTLECRAWILDPPPRVPERTPPVRHREEIPTTWIELTLVEGRNRQVRRMTAAVGHPTLRLIRAAIGRLRLGDLKPGEWREVTPDDVWKFPPQRQAGYGGARRLGGTRSRAEERPPRAPHGPRAGSDGEPPAEVVELRVRTDGGSGGPLRRRPRP